MNFAGAARFTCLSAISVSVRRLIESDETTTDITGSESGSTFVITGGRSCGGTFFIAPAGGTSASAPFWAGIVALADQYAGRHLGFVNPAIYQVGRSAQYHRAFHDVTKGDNTVRSGPFTIKGFNATPGWDPVTGWGSPDAQVLIPLLARYVAR